MEEKYNKFNNINKKIIQLNKKNNIDTFIQRNFFDKKQINELINFINLKSFNSIIENNNEVNFQQKEKKLKLISNLTASPK